jgi:hypothetical protein
VRSDHGSSATGNNFHIVHTVCATGLVLGVGTNYVSAEQCKSGDDCVCSLNYVPQDKQALFVSFGTYY